MGLQAQAEMRTRGKYMSFTQPEKDVIFALKHWAKYATIYVVPPKNAGKNNERVS